MIQKIIDQLAWSRLKKDILNYNLNYLKRDLLAGLLVTAVGFPSLMAFALLAGLNPIYGLYSFIIAAIVGTFVGVSKYVIWGPTNVIALMIASALGSITITRATNMEIVLLLTFMVGIIQIVLSFLNFGKLSNYISRSVITGLTVGIGVVIAAGQLVKVLGLEMAGNGSVFTSLRYIATHLENINFYTFLIASLTFAVILLVKKISSKLPSYLIAVVVAAAVVYFFGLESEITMVKSLESSFSGITIPNLNFDMIVKLSSYAFAIAILGFLDVVIVTEFNKKGAINEKRVNKEFFGLGITNLACSFFNGFVGGGSFSRSFTNYEGGAKTRFSQLFAGIFILLFLLLFSNLITFLPVASLGAILILVAASMIDLEEIKALLTTKKFDALIFVATFFAVILIPRLDYAVYLGIIFSLLLVLINTSKLHYSYLKIDQEGVNQKKLKDMKDEKEIVIDLSGTLHFNTVDKLKKQLKKALKMGDSFVIRMRKVEKIDLTTLSEIEDFVDQVRDKGGDVYFAGLTKEIKEDFKEYGLAKKLGEDNFFSKNDELFASSKAALKEAKKEDE